MNIPSDPELTRRMARRDRWEGVGAGGGFAFDLDFALPFLVTAIHAGHALRRELRPLVEISAAARRFEEDTATERIIQGGPSIIWGLDSRAEYDLNRPESAALPLTAADFWGVRVFRQPPDDAMIQRSLAKHAAFYRFVAGCLQILTKRHGGCVVYDIHAYNISRQRQKGVDRPPLFNLGTALLDRRKWGKAIDAWLAALAAVTLPGQSCDVAENRVFEGRGEFCRRLSGWHPNILVLPTEIAKIYMDEHSGRVFEGSVAALNHGLRKAVVAHSSRWPYLEHAHQSSSQSISAK